MEDHVAQVSGRCYLQFALFHQVVNEQGMVIVFVGFMEL